MYTYIMYIMCARVFTYLHTHAWVYRKDSSDAIPRPYASVLLADVLEIPVLGERTNTMHNENLAAPVYRSHQRRPSLGFGGGIGGA